MFKLIIVSVCQDLLLDSLKSAKKRNSNENQWNGNKEYIAVI